SKAAPIMLEPIVNIDIDAPEAYVGDMTAEIASKRGQITGTQQRSADVISTTGQVPMAELVDFQNRLRSITGGQGSYSVEFSHYAQVPAQMQQQLTSQHKAAREEE
ncbi:MAG: elongation factor G, partial [Burkholderiales bacterium]